MAAAWMGCAHRQAMLDAGNSGSTIRMLSGILAAAVVYASHRWRRIALAAPDGAHHEAAGADGRAIEARENSFRR